MFLTPWIYLLIGLTGYASMKKPECSPSPSYPVDLESYQGKWFEIGVSAISAETYEKDCDCVNANYTLAGPERIKVVNSCRRAGNWSVMEGKAIPSRNASRPGDLFVWFPPQPPATQANYVIVNMWANETIALVGDFCQSYFWILARSRELSTSQLTQILDYALQVGFDPLALGFRLKRQFDCPDN